MGSEVHPFTDMFFEMEYADLGIPILSGQSEAEDGTPGEITIPTADADPLELKALVALSLRDFFA